MYDASYWMARATQVITRQRAVGYTRARLITRQRWRIQEQGSQQGSERWRIQEQGYVNSRTLAVRFCVVYLSV